MSAEIAHLINLHKEWKLAIDKALNALKPAQNVEQVERSNLIRYSNCGKSKSTTSQKEGGKKESVYPYEHIDSQ